MVSGFMREIVFAYITNPSRKTAIKISETLLKKRIAACANIFPIESIYLWKGKIEKAKEFVLIAKTSEKNFGKLKKEVERIHPYEVPCIVKIPVQANEEYAKWLLGEMK